MVHLQRIHEEKADEGLLVFVIAMHPEKDVARNLTRELGVTFPVFDGLDSDLGHAYAYG